VSWTYEQSTGKLFNPDGNFVARGYAGGDCGRHPEGRNNSAMQNVKSIGPLPVGLYTFGDPVLQSHLGPFAIPLIPDPSNDMLGRSDFYCHGDTTPSGSASEGCIIMSRNIRETLWNSLDHELEVISGV
jgi:hypothetical protein